VWHNLSYYFGFYMDGLRKTIKILLVSGPREEDII